MKQQNKHQTLVPLEKDVGQVKDIYKMINQQEQYMEDLLSKYNQHQTHRDDAPIGALAQGSLKNRTLDPSYGQREERAVFSRGHSSDKMAMVPLGLPSSKRASLDLPSISPRRHKKPTKQVKPQKLRQSRPQDPYFLDSKLPHEKDRMKQVLQKAYLQDRSHSLRQSKSSKRPQIHSQMQQLSEPQPKAERESRFQEDPDLKPKEEIPEPMSMGYFSNLQREDSSSEEGEVPLTYYQREYRNMVRAQTVEQTNFLYFSKNESMQVWTQGLLLLFQKHDKELCALRKRCKYLQKFDSNFFSIDIFCND